MDVDAESNGSAQLVADAGHLDACSAASVKSPASRPAVLAVSRAGVASRSTAPLTNAPTSPQTTAQTSTKTSLSSCPTIRPGRSA